MANHVRIFARDLDDEDEVDEENEEDEEDEEAEQDELCESAYRGSASEFIPERFTDFIDGYNDGSDSLALSRVDSHSDDAYDAQVAAAELGGTTPTKSNSVPSRLRSSRMTATTPSPRRTGVSPSSSPRLPSPPPFTEVQIGPKSPTIGECSEREAGEASKQDDGSTRRIRPGTRAADMSSGPPLIPLAELESPFQLQEHLKALYHVHTRGKNDMVTPLTRQTARTLSTPPAGIERPLWLYELCRFLTMKANNLVIAFFADSPPCSASTCSEMRASEWQYLCAVHEPPKSCCAIDYCCHTLDWAANILTSPKYFPSRLTIGGDMGGGSGGSQASMRHLTNIFRRVYRIFAHAWFQHRGVFWEVEGHEGLYMFFKTVCDVYQLIPEDNYTIPKEAESGDGETLETPVGKKSSDMGKLTVLKKNGDPEDGNATETTDGQGNTTESVGATTRRHKHTPSTGSHVTTIAEGPEEEEPSSHDQEDDPSSDPVEPPRGRSLPSAVDKMSQDLKEWSLVDLGTTAHQINPGQKPRPERQDGETNSLQGTTKEDSSVSLSEEAEASAETDLIEGEQEQKGDRAQQASDPAEVSDTSIKVPASSMKTSVETRREQAKEKEDEVS